MKGMRVSLPNPDIANNIFYVDSGAGQCLSSCSTASLSLEPCTLEVVGVFFSDSDRCLYLWRLLQFERRVLVRNSEGDHVSILCVCILSIFLACLSADVKSLLLQFSVRFGKQCLFEYTIDVSLFQSVFGVDWSIIQSSQLVIWCYPLLFLRTLQ
jgi:hypothetical protein